MEPFMAYNVELAERDLALSTRRAYASILTKYAEWLHERPPSPALLRAYLAYLRERGYKAGTIGQVATTLKNFHCFLGQREEVARIRIRRERRLPLYFDKADQARLEAEAERMGPLPNAVLICLLYTGMRKSELLNLRAADCDFRRRLIRVWGSKTRTERMLPMARRVTPLLWERCRGLKGGDRIFNFSRGTVEKIVAKAARGAGIDGFSPHSCRHIFATRLIESKANLEEIRQLLGHSDLTTVALYLAASGEGLRRAMDLLEGQGDAPAPFPAESPAR